MPRFSRWCLAPLALLLTAGAASPAFAGPWTLERNHFYLQVGTAYSHGSDYWDLDGNKQRIKVQQKTGDLSTVRSSFDQLLTNLYFEYGLLNSLTLFGDFPFLNSMQEPNPGSGNIKYNKTGVGDLMLGARVGILVNPLVFALEARLTFPTGDVNAIIPTGTGDFRGELRLVAGKSLRKIPLDFSGEFGFTERGHTTFTNDLVPAGQKIDYSPEIYVRGEITLNLAFHRRAIDRLLVIAAADFRTSTKGPLDTETTFSLIPSSYQLATVSGQVMWFFWKHMGLSARYARGVYGNRVPILDTVQGSIFATY